MIPMDLDVRWRCSVVAFAFGTCIFREKDNGVTVLWEMNSMVGRI